MTLDLRDRNPVAAPLTAGSVLFADSQGRITEDNPNLFWDDTNNKLILGGDTNLYRSAANALATDDDLKFVTTGAGILNPGGSRVLSFPAAGGIRIDQGDLNLATDSSDIILDTTTGTKIGTATTQKLAFWNATPVTQRAFVAAPTGGIAADAEARTAINLIRQVLIDTGLTAAA